MYAPIFIIKAGVDRSHLYEIGYKPRKIEYLIF